MDPAAVRILLADDEPSLLRMMSAYLGRLGYAVTAAGTTAKARAEMEAAPAGFAVAVLDATMPGLAMQELALEMLAASRRCAFWRRAGILWT